MKRELTNNEKALLSLAVSGTFGITDGINIPENIDIKAILQEASAQSILPSVFEGAYALDVKIPEDAEEKYLRMCAAISSSNEQLFALQDEAVGILTENSVPCCIIKGSSVGILYPEPHLRTMGDVDIIVSMDDFDRAVKMFSSAFKSLGDDGKIHHEFTKYGKIIELHRAVNGIPAGSVGELIGERLEHITDHGEKQCVEGHEFFAPSPADTGIVTLIHTYEHLSAGGVGLRHLFDFAVFALEYLDTEKNEKSARELFSMFSEYGIYDFAAYLTASLMLLPGFEDKKGFSWAIPYMGDTAEMLLVDILEGGNFGKKQAGERHISEVIVRDGDKKRNIFVRVFCNFTVIAKTSMPIVNKYPILYPFAFFYIPVRYLFRVITGKRRGANPIKMVKNSMERYDIYENFKMFKK